MRIIFFLTVILAGCFTFAKSLSVNVNGIQVQSDFNLNSIELSWPETRFHDLKLQKDEAVFIVKNSQATFVWQNRKASRSSWNIILHRLLENEAYAECAPVESKKVDQLFSQIKPLMTGNFIASCGEHTVKKLLEDFGHEISSVVQLANDLIQDPKQLFESLISSLKNFNINVTAVLENLVEIGALLANTSLEVAQSVVCDVLAETTSIVAMGAVSGPRGMLSWPQKVSQFAQRIKSRKEFLQFFQRNKEAQKLMLMYSGSLRQVDFGKSVLAKGFTSSERLSGHFKKHAAEFGFKSEQEYLDAAKKFAASKSDKTMIATQNKGNTVFKWNVETNEFLITNTNGEIVSFYKAYDSNTGLARVLNSAGSIH